MSTDLVPFDQLRQMSAALAASGLFGIKGEQQALALMLVAQAEGLHPATVAQDYDIIQGRAARKSHSVLARFQAAGGRITWHQLSDTVAEATFSHPQADPVTLDWTIEMAKRAGLAAKDNWKNYPRAMLRARCIAEGVRATYPAALGGALIDAEAADLPPDSATTIDGATGEIVHGPQRKSAKAASAAPAPANVVDTPPPPPADKPPTPPAVPQGATTGQALPPGMVNYLKSKMRTCGVEEQTILDRFNVTELSTLTSAQFDELKSELLAMV